MNIKRFVYELDRAADQRQKVQFLSLWLLENADQLERMTQDEKELFCEEHLGGVSYMPRIVHALAICDYVTLDPDWRAHAMGWR